jgi:hypothetical protein
MTTAGPGVDWSPSAWVQAHQQQVSFMAGGQLMLPLMDGARVYSYTRVLAPVARATRAGRYGALAPGS